MVCSWVYLFSVAKAVWQKQCGKSKSKSSVVKAKAKAKAVWQKQDKLNVVGDQKPMIKLTFAIQIVSNHANDISSPSFRLKICPELPLDKRSDTK